MMAEKKWRTWREIRAELDLDEEEVAVHYARMEAEERAYKLREIREAQGLTQSEMAERLHLTQPTISALESGDLERSGIATLKSYVAALGGTLEITAHFGDKSLLVA